ncbi:calcium/proton exchanger [Tundrisphaera sp. TA3]|uniref:calcium/proton exchanger n=1 Tax=Tundrisphaera sp. TA3 TaxID=3435775 RepID=UPI003EBD989D
MHGHPARMSWYDPRQFGWEGILLAAVPVAIAASLLQGPAVLRFGAAGVAIIPLASLMGRATEQLAHRLGPAIGGLMNATFGNAAELILAMFALFRGLDDVVKASLTGSIIGNLLLVMGASLLAGGLKFPFQQFNRTAAAAGSTLLVLATMGLIIPAMFHHLVGPGAMGLEHRLSIAVCVILVITYILNLIFSLGTHKNLMSGVPNEDLAKIDEKVWGIRHSSGALLGATLTVAWMSEILVGAVEETSHSLGLGAVFMGVIIVAIVGNAAEHSTAILMAMKNQMDLAVGIALGSALQVALFVAPVLVFASYLRDTPMDLIFSTLEVVAVILAVLIAKMVAEDGESHWLEGAMLLMVYAILGVAFFYLPDSVAGHAAGTAPAAASSAVPHR